MQRASSPCAAAKWRQFVKRRKEERKRGSTGVPQPSEPLHKIIDKHGVAGAAQRLIAHNRSDVSAALVQRGLHKAHKLNSKARRRTISRRVTRALSSAYRDVVAAEERWKASGRKAAMGIMGTERKGFRSGYLQAGRISEKAPCKTMAPCRLGPSSNVLEHVNSRNLIHL